MFSVIIPLYNKEYSIEECLLSVLSQTFSTFQIVIVNDGSEDRSLEVAKKVISENESYDIMLIDKENGGVSDARNVGVASSKYDLICFLDADDSWDPSYLEEMLNLIRKKNDASLFICGYRKFFNDQYQHNYILPKYSFQYIDFFKLSAEYPISVTCSTIIKKDTFNQFRGFPVGKTIGEDLYLWARVAEQFKVAYLGSSLVNIFHQEDQSRKRRNGNVPYILEYYSKNKTNNKYLVEFLKYVYMAHLYESYRKKRFLEFKGRFQIGFKIFPIFSIVSLPVVFIPIQTLKKIRDKNKE